LGLGENKNDVLGRRNEKKNFLVPKALGAKGGEESRKKSRVHEKTSRLHQGKIEWGGGGSAGQWGVAETNAGTAKDN